MKIWCEECEGIGYEIEMFYEGDMLCEGRIECDCCQGKGYTDDPELVSMSFAHYRELKMAASKWRMIEWAIESQTKFIVVPYDKDKPWATHINNDDIDMLIELYQEMKQQEMPGVIV